MAKKILNEATVRRFQKLANMSPINEMYANEQYMKEEEAEAELAPADDMDMKDDDIDMKDDDMDMKDDDMGMGDDEQVVELPEKDADLIKDALPALQNLVSMLDGQMGDDMDADDDMKDDDMGPELDSDPAAGDDLGDDDDDLGATLQEALSGINYVPSQAEIVNEVALRVANRLKSAKLHEAKLNKALGRKK